MFREVYQRGMNFFLPIKVLDDTFQNVEIISGQRLNYCPYSFNPGIEVLDLCHDRGVSHPVITAIGIALRVALMIS